MKFLSSMVVIIFVIQILRSNASKQHKNLETEPEINKLLDTNFEDSTPIRIRATHKISQNSTSSDKTLKPIPNALIQTQIPRIKKGRIHLGKHRMRMHNLDLKASDAQSHSSKVYRRHRKKKVNLSISGENDKPHLKKSNTYINKPRANRTSSCCNKNNNDKETEHLNVNTQTYKHIDQQSSIKPTVYNPISKNMVKLPTMDLENDFSNTTQADSKSYSTPFVSTERSFSSEISANLSLTPTVTLSTTTSKPERFGRRDELHLLATPSSTTKDAQSSGRSTKLQMATVLSVISAMLLMPFLALWLSAVMSAARERVNNTYDDQELLLTTHV